MSNIYYYKGELDRLNSINEINVWIMQNKNQYKWCKENNLLLNSCFDHLPCVCSMNSKESKFIKLYDSLNEIMEYHKLEKYAENELFFYNNIKTDEIKIKEWLIKNTKKASEYLACFLIDYLDYSENENEIYHLLAYSNVEEKIEILIQRNDFKNLIEYIELFDELYYKKKLYPEDL